jgi:predicted metal-binding protein
MIRGVTSQWRATVLVCGKCEKKLGGEGFGKSGAKRLSKLLRKRLRGGWRRKALAGVVTTRCLGVCPRDGVTVVDAAHPGRWIVVPAGTPVDDVVERLVLPDQA